MNLPAILQRLPFLRDLWSKFAPSSNPAASESYYRGIEIMRRGYGLDKKPTVQNPVFDRSYIAGELDRDKEFVANNGDFSDEYQKYSKLDLEYGRVADGALDVLRNYAYLRNLILFHCGNVRDDDLACLAELDKLQSLCVAGTQCNGSFLQYVNPNVNYLRYKYSRLDKSNAHYLERFANIGQIRLEDCSVDDHTINALTAQPFNKLKRIDFYQGAFQDKSDGKLTAPHLHSIGMIDCTGCANITSMFRELQSIDYIDISYSDFPEDDIIRLLTSVERTESDLHLDFSGTSVSDRTLEFIASSSLPKISYLYLDDTSVTQKGIRTLAQ